MLPPSLVTPAPSTTEIILVPSKALSYIVCTEFGITRVPERLLAPENAEYPFDVTAEPIIKEWMLMQMHCR